MNSPVAKKVCAAAFVSVALLSVFAFALNRARSRSVRAAALRQSRIPRTVLWAWERPADLQFIDRNKVGVAYLARTIHLRADEVTMRPRLQPLNVPDHTIMVAVVRVESDRSVKPALTEAQAVRLADEILAAANQPEVAGLQIDFDAAKSERQFYRKTIIEVRRRLPESAALSITALASWCADDDWLADLPVDEAVPMLFRMGPDREQVRSRVSAQEEFSAKPCRGSYGISTDEPLKNLRTDKRLYVFNPDAWTEASVRAILETRK